MTNKTYTLETLADMACIPDEAFPRFVEELPAMVESIRKGNQAGLEFKGLQWTDDGEHKASATLLSRLGKALLK